MTYNTSLLEAATPACVTNSVLVQQFRMDSGFASRSVVISTVLFAITLSVILVFL